MVAKNGLIELVMRPLVFTGEVMILLWQGFKRMFRRPLEVKEVFDQMAFVGVSSIPIVTLTTFASGAVMALYLTPLMLQVGAGGLVGSVLGLTVTRELAPVIAGIMVAARCGSAMAAQIGSMSVTEQLDALKSLGVNPYSYLLVPRMLAGMLMLPILGLIGIYAGMIGGMLVAGGQGVPSRLFVSSVEAWVEPWDFVGGLIKTSVFGLILTIVACQQGLRTSGGAVGVGKSTTNAVVISMVLIYVTNYFLAALFY